VAESFTPARLRDVVADDPDQPTARVNIGPPELPVLITAVVWKNSASGNSLLIVSAAHRPLTIPSLSE